jgi:hypothetical protein
MTDGWGPVQSVDLAVVNADLDDGTPAVDVAIYYPDNLDERHAGKVSIELLVEGFEHSKRIFGGAGVQLNLASFTTGYLDPSLFEVDSTDGPGTPSGRFTNMYRNAERHPSTLSTGARTAFEAIIPNVADADRTVHIIALEDVFMSFYEQLDVRTWQLKTISTGGLSFPGYMYGATMPRHTRGAITLTDITKDENSWKTMAHELGHKLLNVSHEYRSTSPAHEVRADGGLMLYGKGTEIASGPEGRYHRERLHVSPFVYRMRDGAKEWNADYAGDGFYYDEIYEGISVDLDTESV